MVIHSTKLVQAIGIERPMDRGIRFISIMCYWRNRALPE